MQYNNRMTFQKTERTPEQLDAGLPRDLQQMFYIPFLFLAYFLEIPCSYNILDFFFHLFLSLENKQNNQFASLSSCLNPVCRFCQWWACPCTVRYSPIFRCIFLFSILTFSLLPPLLLTFRLSNPDTFHVYNHMAVVLTSCGFI